MNLAEGGKNGVLCTAKKYKYVVNSIVAEVAQAINYHNHVYCKCHIVAKQSVQIPLYYVLEVVL